MNYTIKEEATSGRLPEVGDLWKHDDCSDVYMRIDDDSGRSALGYSSERSFYSANIEDGLVTWTPIDSESIILLQPVGGTMELEEKR